GNYEIVVFGVLMTLLLHRTRDGLAPAFSRWLPVERARARPVDAAPLAKRVQPRPRPMRIASTRRSSV
ncbi:MAG: metal-dependent hydrolase, partial [Vulcanimicrobiaceae bacterium]